jgi:murein DD-endopeptidase MepM/ murein hydrolase activator NlpD
MIWARGAESSLDRPRRTGLARRRIFVTVLILAVTGGVFLAALIRQRNFSERLLAQELRLAQEDVEMIASLRSVYAEHDLPSRTTFSQFLVEAGLDPKTVDRIVRDTRPIYDLARVRAGNRVSVVTSGTGDLRAVSYQIDSDRILWVNREGEGFRAEIQEVPYVFEVAGVAGEIQDSLFQAVVDAGEGVQLALEVADIFGWDLDFNTDPRRGDTFEIVVEKKMLHGEHIGYGRILAARYQNAGDLYQAVLFRDPSGKAAYYAPDGKAMQKAFLRSPLKFSGRVTSGFSHRRFHPILKRYRPHHGVDYAAPTGSPVQAVGDGAVVSAGWENGGGKTVRLRHPKGYETSYLHLSRILVRPGQRVRQGQLIGLSGATGLATGPHLDFRVSQHGRFRNFLTMKLPPAQSVAKKDWDEFVAARDPLLAELEALHAGETEIQFAQNAPRGSTRGR